MLAFTFYDKFKVFSRDENILLKYIRSVSSAINYCIIYYIITSLLIPTKHVWELLFYYLYEIK